MKQLLIILLMCPTIIFGSESNVPQSFSLESIDTKDFPFVWRYRYDMVGSSNENCIRVSDDCVRQMLDHQICKAVAESCTTKDGRFNTKKLELIAKKAKNLVIWRYNDVAAHSDEITKKQVQKDSDAAAAVYNCAETLRLYNQFVESRESMNDLLKK